MHNSIQYFEEKSIYKFEEIENKFLSKPEDFAGMVGELTQELYKLGQMMIKEMIELLDKLLCESKKRCQKYVVEKHAERQLLTSLGTVQFNRTLFQNKDTGKMEFLVDRLINLEKNERISEDAQAMSVS